MSASSQVLAQRRARIGRKPPADPASVWVQQADGGGAAPKALVYTARLTVDVTPEMRGRIKVAAFRRGVTAAEMLRELLEREYPADPGEQRTGGVVR
jgi:hypothetical protein